MNLLHDLKKTWWILSFYNKPTLANVELALPSSSNFFQVHRNRHEQSISSCNFVSHLFNAPNHRQNQSNWNVIRYRISTSPKAGPTVLTLSDFSKHSSLRDTSHPCIDVTKQQFPVNLWDLDFNGTKTSISQKVITNPVPSFSYACNLTTTADELGWRRRALPL